jgi:outer membrane protein OmpA-like peptidoglycan-associated protein
LVLSADPQGPAALAGFINFDVEPSTRNYVLERNQYWRLASQTAAAPALPLILSFSQRIAKAQRLSITFQFKPTSSGLDNRSLEDVRRLAEHINAEPNSGERIMLFGFSDPRGSFDHNLALSRDRALKIATALKERGVALPDEQV